MPIDVSIFKIRISSKQSKPIPGNVLIVRNVFNVEQSNTTMNYCSVIIVIGKNDDTQWNNTTNFSSIAFFLKSLSYGLFKSTIERTTSRCLVLSIMFMNEHMKYSNCSTNERVLLEISLYFVLCFHIAVFFCFVFVITMCDIDVLLCFGSFFFIRFGFDSSCFSFLSLSLFCVRLAFFIQWVCQIEFNLSLCF